MTQTRGKWDSHVLRTGDFWMIWICHGIQCFHFYFLFRNNVIREQLDGNDVSRCYGFFYESVIPKFTFKVLSQQLQLHLKETLQLKILCTWINIGVELAPSHLSYYCMLFFLSNKVVFNFDRIIFETIYFSFYLSMYCVFWRSSSISTLFS